MRNATLEERNSVYTYILSISKDTDVDFYEETKGENNEQLEETQILRKKDIKT